MNRIQKFFTSILPESWAQSMEKDSRRWFMKCLRCGFEVSYWDMGGIRWKAMGNSRHLRKCTQCGNRSWHLTYKKESNNAER
jgi:ribosomal protein L37E